MPPAAAAPTARAPEQPRQKRRLLSVIKGIASDLLVIALAIAVGMSFFDQQIGQWIIVGIGVVALLIRADSRYIFGGALFTLVMIPILTIFQQDVLAENYAVYTFLLLVFGVIRSLFELRNQDAKNTTPSD